MSPAKNFSTPLFPTATRSFFANWNVFWHRAAGVIARWRSGEIEDAVQRNGGIVTDSFERDIAARVGRSQGL
jgi:hypothetical protein